MAHDQLRKLHTSLIDTKRGYDEAIQDAETPELKRIFSDTRDMHVRHHDELHHLLIEAGEKADDSGSFMSTVHKTVIGARAAITGLQGSLASFASGEDRIIKEYDDALKEASVPSARDTLMRQREAVQSKALELRALADKAA